jgi:hypothetical protein
MLACTLLRCRLPFLFDDKENAAVFPAHFKTLEMASIFLFGGGLGGDWASHLRRSI